MATIDVKKYNKGIIDHYEKTSNGKPVNEIISLRKENSKTFDNQDGSNTLIASTGLVHYKENYQDSKEQWKDIDTTQVDKGDHFLVEKSPVIVKIYKDKVGYEITARRTGHKFIVELMG